MSSSWYYYRPGNVYSSRFTKQTGENQEHKSWKIAYNNISKFKVWNSLENPSHFSTTQSLTCKYLGLNIDDVLPMKSNRFGYVNRSITHVKG